mmetsp:Transcript_30530/g.57531  ORF Transcript_30530/g.57531 Transcript_30530/m.57531 type:complete len:171 (-) Transcript_30530:312-824(-)
MAAQEPAASPSPVPEAAPATTWADYNLTGLWEKDTRRSDSEKTLFDVMEMGWVFAQAAKLLNSLEVVQDSSNFKVITAASVISISEVYPLAGQTVPQNRRDMRNGSCEGSVQLVPEPLGVQLKLRFEGQPSGSQEEMFRLDGPQTLIRETRLTLDNGKSWSGKTVYVRKR